jgi:transposase
MFNSDVVKIVLDIHYENNIKNIKTYYSKISKLINNKYNIKISRHTISKWINNKNNIFKNRIKRDFFKEFKKTPYNLFTKKSKLKKINLDLVSNYINFYPNSSRYDIRAYIFKDFNILLSLSSITNIIKKIGLTRKKIKYQVIKNIDYLKELNKKRNDFKLYFKNKYFKKLIFIDEVGFNFSNLNDKGLSKKGVPIYMPDKTRFMRNLSMIMSLNSDCIIHYEIYEESINNIKFYSFIQNIIKKLNSDGYTFIFDNVSFHHNKETLNLIKETNNNFIFTPPYSPNFNPIENVFGIIKNNYKNNYKKISIINRKFSVKEQIKIIDDSILEFITVHYINIDAFIYKALNYSYDDIENECYLRYK